MNRIYVSFLLCFLTLFSFAMELTGKVVRVTDGDTITVLCDQKMVKIRLNEIDSPERGQPFGKAAKKFTSDLAFGKEVTVQTHGQDKYGRTIGNVILPNGNNLNRELVKAGLAWWYRKYSKDESIGELEKEAREKKLGLWADKNPIPPWDWRKGVRTSTKSE